MTKAVELVKLSDAGNADEVERYRWAGSPRLSAAHSWRLCLAQPAGPDFPEVVVDMDSRSPVEDMPWCGSRGHIVSDRLRRLIEANAPKHAQFLPAILLFDGEPLDIGCYWATNWLHMVDCFHRELSEYDRIEDGSEPDGFRLSFDNLVIDASRIPPEILVCRVKHYENVCLIRQRLRSVLDAAGVTGVQYYPVQQL